MHIAIVTETYPPEVNGVAMTISRLVDGLLKRGHHVELIRPRQEKYDRPGCCDTPEIMLVKGLPIPGYPGIRMGYTSRQRLVNRWRLATPDAIYVATEGPLGYATLRAAEILGIPIISGFHTNFHTYSEHYHAKLLKATITRYLRNFHNRTALTLVPNQVLADDLQALGIDNTKIFSRGVDCQLFTPEKRNPTLRAYWGADENNTVALYVGRLAHEKNIELAIRAYRDMHKTDPRLKFVVVGDGPLYGELKRKNPDLIFCGIHRGKKLAEYYASADIFLFPSETETFGNVTLEAMASGLAVLAYDYAAARMHIRDGENGFVVPLGGSHLFSEKGVRLLEADNELQYVRENARQHALGVDWSAHIRLFEEMLFSVQQKLSAAI